MPDSASRLPAHPSLEQLRTQAKELLRQYRAGDPAAMERFRACQPRLAGPGRSEGAALADAQLVLAREHGFESWARLKRHIEAGEPPTLEHFERLAKDLVTAYGSGDPGALDRIQDHYQRPFTREELRAELRHRLAALPDTERRIDSLAPADAQLIIAREHGFETWSEFAERMGRPSRGPRPAPVETGTAQPERLYYIDWKNNRIEPRQTLTEQGWDALIGVTKEKRIAALNAGGQMTDALLERISALDHLTGLELQGSKRLTDAGVRHLARLPRLQHLDLSGSGISDRGLEVLARLPGLRSLSLYHHGGISDAGLAALKHCDLLEHVDLMGTPTGDGAIEALTGKPQLSHFKAGNRVTDAGLALLHQFPAFRTWQGGEVGSSLMSPEADPNFLWLNLKAPFTNQGLANLVGLDGLFALSMFGGPAAGPFDSTGSRVTPAGLGRLADLPNLGWLGCTAALCDDEAMRHISTMPRLRMLMCQDTVAGDDGFAALSRSQSIEYIWGRRCYNLGGRGFTALAAMPALRGLSVSCRNVDDAGLSALPGFPALDTFMPMDVPDDGFRHVARCHKLEALYCMYCRDTTDTATGHIAGLSRLKTYEAFTTRITDQSLEILGRVPSLERLRFHQCAGLTDRGLAFLAGLPRLRQVDLSHMPNLTPEGAAVFPAHVRVTWDTAG
jgi:hypothetical protein